MPDHPTVPAAADHHAEEGSTTAQRRHEHAGTTTDATTRRILVLGSTGMMGREVLSALVRRGAHPRVLVRDPARLTTSEGVDVHVGDLRDGTSLRAALTGVDAVFHMSPHEADEVELTRSVLTLCEELGVRVVFAGVAVEARHAVVGWLMRRAYGILLPRYRGKLALARMVERSRTRPVVLVPSNFMQNDEVFGDEIREGLFVHPASPKGLNRVDLRDLGEVAAGILLDPGFPSGTYPVVGPRDLTGPGCAQTWEEALGRPVRYAGHEDAALDAALRRHLTGHRLGDWAASMHALRGFAVRAKPRELETTTRLLGRAPTDYADYVRDTVASWAVPGRGSV
jgi:uncharacterized protein YbjT (DUF2867 family)